MIITKSIARFARNTVDCLKYVRLLNDLGVDVYFEEQGIHSNQPGAEFYITIYGSIAQSESENISANIKWGKAQSAKEGKVIFQYKNFLGYRKGEDGQPEIVPEEAETIRFIYDRFLAGDSLKGIAKLLEEKGIKSPTGKAEWQFSTIQSILSNERYKGDAIINKTYIDFVNEVAEAVEKEFPDVLVETLAYRFTRNPPKTIWPRHNVAIRSCTIEAASFQTLETPGPNSRLHEDMIGWAPRLRHTSCYPL